jgi:glutaredoxin
MELEHNYTLVDEIGFDEFSKKFPGVQTVPQIMWDDEHVGGYQEFAVKVNEYITKESEESDND